MIASCDIICISTSDWKGPWGSKQQLMERLSLGNRILYVEYQTSFLHILLWISRLKNRFKKVNDNLFIYTPFPYLPFGYYFRIINIINQAILALALNRILKKIGFVNPILWIYAPCSVDLLGKVINKCSIYHCIADFSNEKKSYLRKKTIANMEKELVKRSNITLASTEKLYLNYKDVNNNTFLFPSAVDAKFFSSFLAMEFKEPEDIINLKRPRIGLVGYLDGDILDVDLLCYIADQRPEWQLILIGPKFRHINRLNALAKRNNVHFLAEKKNIEIPAYIKYLDVCIIPYVINKYTNNVSSLKLYEYLALGKPIVSTNFAELMRFKNIIRIAKNREEFIEDIILSLQEKDAVLIHERVDFAEKNSWVARLSMVSKLIEGNSCSLRANR